MYYLVRPVEGKRLEACTALAARGLTIVSDVGLDIKVSTQVEKEHTLSLMFTDGLIENYRRGGGSKTEMEGK